MVDRRSRRSARRGCRSSAAPSRADRTVCRNLTGCDRNRPQMPEIRSFRVTHSCAEWMRISAHDALVVRCPGTLTPNVTTRRRVHSTPLWWAGLVRAARGAGSCGIAVASPVLWGRLSILCRRAGLLIGATDRDASVRSTTDILTNYAVTEFHRLLASAKSRCGGLMSRLS